MTYSADKKIEIYNDKTGEKTTISHDKDSLGLVEIDSDSYGRLILPTEVAKLIAKHLPEIIEDVERNSNEC